MTRGGRQHQRRDCRNLPRAHGSGPGLGLSGAALALALAGTSAGSAYVGGDGCDDGELARLCPQRCGSLCRSDRAYYLAHREFCLSSRAFDADTPDSDPRCADLAMAAASSPESTAAPPKVPMSLPDCLAAARNGAQAPTERLALLNEDSKMTRSLQAVLEGMPDCAPDIATLGRMHACLDADAAAVAEQASGAGGTDYGSLDSSAELCRIPLQTLRRDYEASRLLGQRLTATRQALADLSDCKDAYRAWARDRVQGAQASGLVQAWIEGQEQELGASSEAIAALATRVEALQQSLERGLEHMRLGLVVCPAAVEANPPRLGEP